MKKAEKVSWFGRLVVGFVLLGLAVVGVELWHSYAERKWDGRTRFTVFDLRNPVTIWSVDPGDMVVTKFVLPEELEVPMIGKGHWLVKSIPGLSEKNGAGWAANSISAYLGIPYTGILGQMGFWDNLSWWFLKRGKTEEALSIENTSLIMKKFAPDGLVSYGLSSLWKKKASDMYFSSVIATSGWRLGVFNPTGISGLGAKIARIAETAGYKVVFLSEGKIRPDGCVVFSRQDQKEDLGVVWLLKYFNCAWSEGTNLGSGEIELVLGNEFSDWSD